MIPRLIHQTWKDKNVPLDIYHEDWIRSWKKHNPRWKHILWTDDDIKRLTNQHRPDLLPLLNDTRGVLKSQVLRFLVLELYGGLYVDLDYECLRNFDGLLDRNFLFAATMNHFVSDALMLARPGQKFFDAVLDELLLRYEQPKILHFESMCSFVMLTDMVLKHNLKEHVAAAKYFSPLDWRKKECLAGKHKTLPELREILKGYPEAYAVTYWTHNW